MYEQESVNVARIKWPEYQGTFYVAYADDSGNVNIHEVLDFQYRQTDLYRFIKGGFLLTIFDYFKEFKRNEQGFNIERYHY